MVKKKVKIASKAKGFRLYEVKVTSKNPDDEDSALIEVEDYTKELDVSDIVEIIVKALEKEESSED